jgi:FHS family Na+ dependent glucose MFS transporter 1
LDTQATLAGHTPRTRSGAVSKTAAYYLAFVALGTTGAVLGPTLSGLAEHTHTQLSQISLLFTAGWLGYLLGSLLGGRLYDRRQGHPVMAVALIAMAAMLGLAPLPRLLWLSFAAFLILGIAQGTLDVGGNTLLAWVHTDEVAPYMNGLHFFFGLGATLSPFIIAQAMLLSGDITWAYWTLAVLMLPAAVWLLRLRSPAIQSGSEDGLVRPVDRRLLALIVVFCIFLVGVEVSFGGWIFSYAVATHLGNETTAAYLTSAFWATFTLGRLLAIPVAFRLRPSAMMSGGLVGCLISLGIILLWSNSSLALWLGTVGMGLSMAPIFPTAISFVGRRMSITGRVIGWFFVGASLGSMSMPWLIGQLFEPSGPQAALIIMLLDTLLALCIFLVIKLRFPQANSDLVQPRTGGAM